MAETAAKTVRVIAKNAADRTHKTVNIVTSLPTDKDGKHSVKTRLQAAGDQGRQIETVQDSGGTVAGLQTIFISGYSAPN